MKKKIAYTKPYACCIIDIIEDFLDDKGVDIPNDEKDGDETEAHIYGTDFDDLMFDISKVFENFCTNNNIPCDTESWTEEEVMESECYADDVTGTIGSWLETGFDNSVPMEARKHLEEAYRLCLEKGDY